ncbi:MAG: flagellar assembly protein FliX [Rhodospirillaceae bacterium]|nr:flagellar assembly protein FliX [Rhodospirillaceae bacterium]
MKVEGPKGPSSVNLRRARKTERAGGGAGFAEELDRVTADSGPGMAAPADLAAPVAHVEGLLAAQSVDPDARRSSPDERKRRAQKGVDILDRLEELRRGLLMGAVPKDRLADLARIVREKREKGADPVISRLLDEIELRAEVELAKLSRRLA